mgnify:CR=1 FL=1
MIKISTSIKYAIIIYIILIILIIFLKPKIINVDTENPCKKYILPLIGIIGAVISYYLVTLYSLYIKKL